MTTAPTRTPTPVGVPFARDLASFGAATALVADGTAISYAELADRVEARGRLLGDTRRLVMISGTNEVETLVTYLAALAGGHPVLLVPADNAEHVATIAERYDPDVVASGTGETWSIDVRRAGTAHHLHPDLALLLSTSGSTGSPKLVRLSAENLQSNAEAIATYLGIVGSDRAATTLPLHYCYGLSVVHSHLTRGACLVLTELSVVDACFWDLVRREGVTTFAGVPYTFELLDRVGFSRMKLPSLRYLTQAGGRMRPERVRALAALGQTNGWELVVMYGQTEATARMGYLPPELAEAHPEAVGVPIPGGSFRVVATEPRDRSTALPDGVVGELVYSGPNVMLGYAEGPADLALDRTTDELHTGDLARISSGGLVEIIGRSNRVAKTLGLRVDLDRLERLLLEQGFVAACASSGERLVVAAETFELSAVRDWVRRITGLPSWAVDVVGVPDLPRTPAGKPCYAAVAGMATETGGARAAAPSGTPAPARTAPASNEAVSVAELCALLSELLGRDDVSEESSFVSLDGDSLSYVEVSLRLEETLGVLPEGWHTMSIQALVGAARHRPDHEVARGSRRLPRWRRVEANVVIRALAIVLIVGSHANVFALAGGAHVLLAAAGFNLGRFHLTPAPRSERVRHLVTSVLRIAVPSIAVIGLIALATGDYPLPTVLLLNGVLGPDGWSEPEWYFWFVEALVWSLLAVAAVVAVPAVDRLERRHPFALAMGVLGLALLPRYGVLGLGGDGDRIHAGLVVCWLLALGWAAAKASTMWQRGAVTIVAVATLPGFFDDLQREAIVAAGVTLLVWVPTLPIPRRLVPLLGTLAGASLYIYLTHWQVYPWLEYRWPVLALLSSLAVGIVTARLLAPLTSKIDRLVPRPRLGGHDSEPAGDRTPVRRGRSRRDRLVVPS